MDRCSRIVPLRQSAHAHAHNPENVADFCKQVRRSGRLAPEKARHACLTEDRGESRCGAFYPMSAAAAYDKHGSVVIWLGCRVKETVPVDGEGGTRFPVGSCAISCRNLFTVSIGVKAKLLGKYSLVLNTRNFES